MRPSDLLLLALLVVFPWGAAGSDGAGPGLPGRPPAGSLSREQIREVMRVAVRGIVWCAEESAVPCPDTRLTLELSIAPDGTVSWARATAPSDSPPAYARCAKGELRRLRFPASSDGASVKYPFLPRCAGEARGRR